MKFGIITPVFDGCLESLELLYQELGLQTHTDWVWMLCSNGFSEKLSRFVHANNNNLSSRGLTNSLQRKCQLVYVYTDYEEEESVFSLLRNIGKRRDFCIRHMNTDYIFMIDADAKILDRRMFETISSELERNPRSICIYKVIHEDGVLPIFPIGYGRIDMLNFCVKGSLAREVGYPTTVKPEAPGNDFWYFDRAYKASGGDYIFIDKVFCQHNGNNRYVSLLNLLRREIHAREEAH